MGSIPPASVRIVLSKRISVTWESGGECHVSRVQNLSLGGMFILTPNPPPVGNVVKLSLNLQTGEVQGRAVVRHAKRGKGMGVKFISMDQEGRARLKRLMAEQLQK